MVKLCLNCGRLEHMEHECRICGSKNIVEVNGLNVTMGDYMDICKISNDGNFIYEMFKLKNDNPIEYQLKLQQFQSIQNNNIPHCPHCSSTNISKISATERVGSIAMLGIFSKKINKSFKCRDCGYTW